MTMVVLVVLIVAAFACQPAHAQQLGGAEARTAQRVEFGFSGNHQGEDIFPAVTYRLTGALDRDRFLTVEGGVLATPNPAIDAGLRVRFPVGRRMAALLSGGSGLLIEDGYVGPFWRFGTGLEWRVGARTTLSATVEAGGHDARDYGPHFVMFGIERRFGRH
jgi:hypothetical protein